MSYYDLTKPDFRIECWLSCCRGLIGQNREKWINFITESTDLNLKPLNESEQQTTIINLIISLVNTYYSNLDYLLEDIIEQAFNEPYIN